MHMMETTQEIHPEDEELIAQLAKLQQTHRQLKELRSLLPTKLIGSVRQATNQRQTIEPRSIALTISKTARQGQADITSFKKDWNEPKTRQLFKDASAAKSDTPQGSCTWWTDYGKLLKDKPVQVTSQKDLPFDTLEEAKVVIDAFNKTSSNKAISAGDTFPLRLDLRGRSYNINRDETEKVYTVEAEAGGTLATRVAEQVMKGGPWKQLKQLLPYLNAHHDIRLRKCDKCHRLNGARLELPIVRVLKNAPDSKVKTEHGTLPEHYAAYHAACVG